MRAEEMKTRVVILMFTVGLLVLNPSSGPVGAQSPIPPLPNDLLFVPTISGGEVYFSRNTILRVDARTLETSPFYVDDEAWEIVPLSWSPQGDLLAIYRIMPADQAYSYSSSPRKLCILDRDGVLQRCLDDSPPMHYAGSPSEWQHYYPVAWGPDGQTIYFDTEYPNEESVDGYGRRLVEASVLTGETLRVVYDYPDAYAVNLSPDLKHLTVGFGEQWYPENPAFLSDLTSGVQLDLADLVPDLTWLSRGCIPFSPQGSYVTAITRYDLFEYAPELEEPDDYRNGSGDVLVLLAPDGTVRHIIGDPSGSPATMWYHECPCWQADGQAIVFYAYGAEDRRIMRYSLPDQQTTTLYELGGGIGHESYVYSPLIPSPDGTHVALTVSDEPYGTNRLVAVLYPDGNIYRIPSPYRFGLYPLWVPPDDTG
jgi:hypothetical protein